MRGLVCGLAGIVPLLLGGALVTGGGLQDGVVGLPAAAPHGEVVDRQAVFSLQSLPAMVVDGGMLTGAARAMLSCDV